MGREPRESLSLCKSKRSIPSIYVTQSKEKSVFNTATKAASACVTWKKMPRGSEAGAAERKWRGEVLFEVDNPAGKLNHGAAEVRDLEDAVKERQQARQSRGK